jgi:hypothetical protein
MVRATPTQRRVKKSIMFDAEVLRGLERWAKDQDRLFTNLVRTITASALTDYERTKRLAKPRHEDAA